MPRRKIHFEAGKYYFVSNTLKSGLWDNNEKQRNTFISFIYYNFKNPPVKFSRFLKFPEERKNEILGSLIKRNEKYTDITALVVLPNGYQALLREKDGISIFLSLFQNSTARACGAVFSDRFQALKVPEKKLTQRIESIHTAPPSEASTYRWSSISEYQNPSESVFFSLPSFIS